LALNTRIQTMKIQKIKNHWNELAAAAEHSYKASWDDYYMLQKEIAEISNNIQCTASICDMGCNNGYCDFELLKRHDKLRITGIDFSEKAIEQANKIRDDSPYKERCTFLVGNILDVNSYPADKFDTIIVKRTLINLISDEAQLQAVHNLFSMVWCGGNVIIMEAVEENLQRLNKLRAAFDLPDLVQPWHNRYLSKSVVNKLSLDFCVSHDDDYSSSYYVLSRVVYPWIAKITNSNVEYLNEINRVAMLLPNFGDYGIQRIFILYRNGEI